MSTSTYFLHLIQIRSAPVGYAAEYLTCGSFAALTTGLTLLMFMRVLYHICISIWRSFRVAYFLEHLV